MITKINYSSPIGSTLSDYLHLSDNHFIYSNQDKIMLLDWKQETQNTFSIGYSVETIAYGEGKLFLQNESDKSVSIFSSDKCTFQKTISDISNYYGGDSPLYCFSGLFFHANVYSITIYDAKSLSLVKKLTFPKKIERLFIFHGVLLIYFDYLIKKKPKILEPHSIEYFAQNPLSFSVLAHNLSAFQKYLQLHTHLVNQKEISSETPLHIAVRIGHIEKVSLLLQHGADPKMLSHSGKTPLDLAIQMKQEESPFQQNLIGRFDIIQRLLNGEKLSSFTPEELKQACALKND